MILNEKSELIARFAMSKRDIEAAQRLRFQIFYQEMSAQADEKTLLNQLDQDEYDPYCTHILIINKKTTNNENAILVDDGELLGTYRLLSQQQARHSGGFYSQNEFDIDALINRKPQLNFLELGRSCVAKHARTKPVLELLWQEIWNYTRQNKIDILFGCASLEGVCYQDNDLALRYMMQNHQAPKEWTTRPVSTSQQINISNVQLSKSQERKALALIPALIKSYLKVGAFIAPHAVIDVQFNVTDVLIMLPIENIREKYLHRFGRNNLNPL